MFLSWAYFSKRKVTNNIVLFANKPIIRLETMLFLVLGLFSCFIAFLLPGISSTSDTGIRDPTDSFTWHCPHLLSYAAELSNFHLDFLLRHAASSNKQTISRKGKTCTQCSQAFSLCFLQLLFAAHVLPL